MIRRSSSLFISLFVHAILLLIFFFAYKSYFDYKEIEEEVLCVKLCSVELNKEKAEKKEIKEPKAVKKVEIQKEIIEKKINITDEAVDAKPFFAEKTEEEVMADAKPLSEAKEKSVVEKELKSVSIEQKIDDVALVQKAPQDEYLEINMQKIAQLLEENLYYPMSARKRNITGFVKVSFTLGIDAKVDNIKIIESKSDILSRAAIKTIEDLSTKFPKPTKEITLSVPINYNLN
ncbi:MAG: periplasmic protein TonB [Campylobacterota bacterium]|nr:periplasmic protein TonB [Campylobacterota bacterium]